MTPGGQVKNGLGGFLEPLRKAALIALGAGAAGSIALMLRVGHPPVFLRVLFAIWVLSPFAVIVLADRLSASWSVETRTTLYVVALVLAAGSLAAYAYMVVRHPVPTPTFIFVIVPPVSWLLTAITVPTAAFLSRRPSRPGPGSSSHGRERRRGNVVDASAKRPTDRPPMSECSLRDH